MLNAHALHAAARRVSGKLGTAEQAIDESLEKTASLLASLPAARAAANLPVSTGHKAIMRVLASLNAIAQARDEMLAAHVEFAETGADLRLPEVGLGGLVPCPTEDSLRLVPSAVA